MYFIQWNTFNIPYVIASVILVEYIICSLFIHVFIQFFFYHIVSVFILKIGLQIFNVTKLLKIIWSQVFNIDEIFKDDMIYYTVILNCSINPSIFWWYKYIEFDFCLNQWDRPIVQTLTLTFDIFFTLGFDMLFYIYTKSRRS